MNGRFTRTDLVLLVYGVTSLPGIWIIGVLLDRLGVAAFSPMLLVQLLLATLVWCGAQGSTVFRQPARKA